MFSASSMSKAKCSDRELEKANTVAENADGAIRDAEALSGKLGKPLPERSRYEPPFPIEPPQLRPWEEIVHEARLEQPGTYLRGYRDGGCDQPFIQLELRVSPRSTSSLVTTLPSHLAAGIFAGLADIFLVQVPKHPGFLGGPAAEGGWLSNVIKERFNELLPEDTVHWLEGEYPSPSTHPPAMDWPCQYEGLGHVHIACNHWGTTRFFGWLFGVRDVLMGKFTAIGSDGQIVIQVSFPGGSPPSSASVCSSRSWKRLNWWPVISCPMWRPVPAYHLRYSVWLSSFSKRQ